MEFSLGIKTVAPVKLVLCKRVLATFRLNIFMNYLFTESEVFTGECQTETMLRFEIFPQRPDDRG